MRISNLPDRDPIFREAITAAQVLDPLESLLGPNIEMLKNRHNHATLRLKTGRPERLHRDVLQWSRTIVTVIFYLEEATVENGCTLVVPGTHFLPGARSLHNIDQEEWIRQSGLVEQAMPAPMPAGGLLAIDSTIFHSVGTNRTEGTRMSMTVGYHSVDELSDVDNPARWLVRGERIYMGNDY